MFLDCPAQHSYDRVLLRDQKSEKDYPRAYHWALFGTHTQLYNELCANPRMHQQVIMIDSEFDIGLEANIDKWNFQLQKVNLLAERLMEHCLE